MAINSQQLDSVRPSPLHSYTDTLTSVYSTSKTSVIIGQLDPKSTVVAEATDAEVFIGKHK